MNLTVSLFLIFILFFLILMISFWILEWKKPILQLRNIPALTALSKTIGISIEAAKRIHFSLGRGTMANEQGAAGLVGLSVQEKIAEITVMGDKPPITTSGDGALMILSQDTMRGSYQSVRRENEFDQTASQFTGATPLSYAVGTLPIIFDEQTSLGVLLGHFGNEVAIISDASSRHGNVLIAGSEDLTAQSIIYAMADEPLIGEEVFAAGAYLKSNPMHKASLHAQDVIRWILIAAIIVGSILKLAGIL